ncbi:hypothetical protein BDV41DRAFT_583485 [Aspergillus transmontanensis]|uniref:Uncharacterized protein n=1 Tax=Aspergillus transmontanensis TaxID=1034304 RepID=A0A5N6VCR9_9EURO|nr:hypothetical protein BDV41DRAFT_583485 [Aspergillus transmontanensis]
MAKTTEPAPEPVLESIYEPVPVPELEPVAELGFEPIPEPLPESVPEIEDRVAKASAASKMTSLMFSLLEITKLLSQSLKEWRRPLGGQLLTMNLSFLNTLSQISGEWTLEWYGSPAGPDPNPPRTGSGLGAVFRSRNRSGFRVLGPKPSPHPGTRAG